MTSAASIAHANGLVRAGILTRGRGPRPSNEGLRCKSRPRSPREASRVPHRSRGHPHEYRESALTERIGDARRQAPHRPEPQRSSGGRHAHSTRKDVVDVPDSAEDSAGLQGSLVELGRSLILMPCFPATRTCSAASRSCLAHHLLAYVEMLERDARAPGRRAGDGSTACRLGQRRLWPAPRSSAGPRGRGQANWDFQSGSAATAWMR